MSAYGEKADSDKSSAEINYEKNAVKIWRTLTMSQRKAIYYCLGGEIPNKLK